MNYLPMAFYGELLKKLETNRITVRCQVVFVLEDKSVPEGQSADEVLVDLANPMETRDILYDIVQKKGFRFFILDDRPFLIEGVNYGF